MQSTHVHVCVTGRPGNPRHPPRAVPGTLLTTRTLQTPCSSPQTCEHPTDTHSTSKLLSRGGKHVSNSMYMTLPRVKAYQQHRCEHLWDPCLLVPTGDWRPEGKNEGRLYCTKQILLTYYFIKQMFNTLSHEMVFW